MLQLIFMKMVNVSNIGTHYLFSAFDGRVQTWHHKGCRAGPVLEKSGAAYF